jgi:saccharopine dehydrogenase (NADP+, L-glutamate forming)
MSPFSSKKALVIGSNLLDTLCAQLEKLMSFQLGERDLVMLQHKFVVEWTDGTTASRELRATSILVAHISIQDTFTSTLELLGDPKGHSAMLLSVGVTCGIVSQLLLNCLPALRPPGIAVPYKKEICDPTRELLEKEGIKMVEKRNS